MKELEIEGFTNHQLKEGYSQKTITAQIYEIKAFLKWIESENIRIELLTYNDVINHLKEAKKTRGHSGMNGRMLAIKHYLNYLVKINDIESNPIGYLQFKGKKEKIVYNYLDQVHLDELYENFEIKAIDPRDPNNNQNWYRKMILSSKRNKCLLGLIIYQGLDSTALNRLEVEDLKLREGKVFIKRGRNYNSRTLTLESHQLLDLMEYVKYSREELKTLTKNESDYLFISTKPVKEHTVTGILEKLIKQLKSQNKKVHSFKQIRASVINNWLKMYNLREVQIMAGHRYVSSTEAYQTNDLEDLQSGIEKYHPF